MNRNKQWLESSWLWCTALVLKQKIALFYLFQTAKYHYVGPKKKCKNIIGRTSEMEVIFNLIERSS